MMLYIEKNQVIQDYPMLLEKYGFENFEKEIIDRADTLDELNRLEEFYIKKYNSQDRNIGYNIKFGGENCLHSIETKKKIGLRTKERFLENEYIRNRVLFGLKKGTDAVKERAKEFFVEKNVNVADLL